MCSLFIKLLQSFYLDRFPHAILFDVFINILSLWEKKMIVIKSLTVQLVSLVTKYLNVSLVFLNQFGIWIAESLFFRSGY